MIKAARAQLPSTVKLAVGQVVDIKTSPTRQQVHLASGETIDCRLVVLATGHEKGLLNKLAISRRTICNDHSLAIGFDIVADTGNPLEGSVLVHYGDEIRDRMDYIKIFPLPDALRANLFCFQGISEPWSRNFRHRPREMLLQVMPGLQRFIPDFDIPGKVQIRTNHLIEAEDYLRDGLVLIGDAFKISCPAAGAGVTRLLTDVDRLCNVHVPRWLAKSDTSIEQIGQFYTDPVKRACDIQAARLGEYPPGRFRRDKPVVATAPSDASRLPGASGPIDIRPAPDGPQDHGRLRPQAANAPKLNQVPSSPRPLQQVIRNEQSKADCLSFCSRMTKPSERSTQQAPLSESLEIESLLIQFEHSNKRICTHGRHA